MRIGISILTHQGHNLWNNGIGQNVYHLASALERIPFVERVVLLNCGDQEYPPGDSGEMGSHFPLIPLRDASSDIIDVAIEMSGGLDVEWLARFRARGGRVAFANCGQPYAAMIEPAIFKRPSFFSEAERCDEVWLLPKDRAFTAMMRSIHRCPAYEVPYLWAPTFLLETAKERPFGYQPGSLQPGKVCPAIFEPNVSPIKMGLIPLMICEEIERREPAIIERVRLLNSKHMSDQATFRFLIENLDLGKHGKIEMGGRDYFAHVMATGANMVVSHQIDCAQNYLYLDAVCGGYPLIHNSEMFTEIGYYYPRSDVEAGAAQFRLALQEHDRNFDAYTTRSRRAIDALSPANPVNLDAYARRLVNLTLPERAWKRA
ncbi:DUF2827 family protein [Labrys okinawensis]|uniref:DUF2827 family protein n=1 Tax=Labrys okinawensis TaxID=346911 RepID=UPI0039BD619C